MTDLVSIIIPCYNAEKWIGEAIDSALRQTYSPIEVIVVDDESSDNSLSIIKKYGDKIKWASYENGGASTARNRGVQLSQGQFIEETIRSVLLRGYPNLEYIIVDGGSTDNSVEIIKKYEHWISSWVSESDNGQSQALNKGFRKATGSLIGWQNSDDYYHPQAFMEVAIKSIEVSEISVFYGLTDQVDVNSNFICVHPISEFDIHAMLPLLNMCNQSMFFRNRIFLKESL